MFISEYILSHYITHTQTPLVIPPFTRPTAHEYTVITRMAEEYGCTINDKAPFLKNAEHKTLRQGSEQALNAERQTDKPQAVVFAKGPFTIPSAATLDTEEGMIQLTIAVIHEDLVRARYQAIAKQLLDGQIMTLLEGQDEEFLLQALEETDETVRYEEWGKQVPGCPLFNIQFKADGTFTLSNWETISS